MSKKDQPAPAAPAAPPPDMVERLDLFAVQLIDDARAGNGGKPYLIDKQLAVFKEIASWVKIKHGLTAAEEPPPPAATEGSVIRELKAAIKANADQRASGTGPESTRAGKSRPKDADDGLAAVQGSGAPGAREPPLAPATLAAIKSHLPRANAGDVVGHRRDAGGAVHPADERHRELHADLLSDTGDDDDDGDGSC